MCNQLYLRARGELMFDHPGPDLIYGDGMKDYSFRISRSGQNINVKVLTDGKTIEAETILEDLKPDTLEILKADDYDKLDENEKMELRKVTTPIRESMRQLVGLIKQELNRLEISDELIGNLRFEWSVGDGVWHPIPRGLKVSASVYGFTMLNGRKTNHIQKLLAENEEALVATSYLHQARKVRSNRYKWIYATIAAELAIKEILGRIEPKLQVILGSLPSPPLNKLYGDVLESVAGVRSIGLNKLREGAERRNRFLHSPESDAPSFDETHEYISFIDDRIKGLTSEWRRMRQEKGQNDKRG